MDEFFDILVSSAEIEAEKRKARELRRTQWWKNKKAAGRCHYCGRRFPVQELTMDHIVPLVRGGKSVKGNVVPCCKECNNQKMHWLPIEWESYLARLSGHDP